MPYFECRGCGQLAELGRLETTDLRQHCPVCDEQTTWSIAFEADSGVSL